MITEEMVSHVAKVARLSLTPEEKQRYTQELGKIMELIDELSALDLSHEQLDLQTDQPTLLRPDSAYIYPQREKLMANAPQEEDGFFRVPKILEEGN